MDESIFRAYDIRGIYPEQISADIAYQIGQAYVDFVKPAKSIVVGRDVRLHSEELQQALIKGITDTGVDVIDIGLISTEMLYFAVGNYNYGGGIISTASHNPKEWHGFKFVREDVVPISGDSGIKEIQDFVNSEKKIESETKGKIEKKDILDDFCKYALTWVNPSELKNITLVYNANFGFEGKVLERLVKIGKLPAKLISLNSEPDGNFPKGRPDPFIPENRTEFIELVKNRKADLGVTWDADADRVFFCADGGTFVDPYYTNVLLVKSLLSKNPGECVVYEPRYTWAVLDVVKSLKGRSAPTRVGHTLIKAQMRKENAIFAGESSGHTFFRDFWFSDSGMITFLLMWELLSKENKNLSELVRPLIDQYPISGEISFTTEKKTQIMDLIEKKYDDAKISRLDGITIEYPKWRTNIRAANTEPLLRLNVEAKSKELMEQKRDELLRLISSLCS